MTKQEIDNLVASYGMLASCMDDLPDGIHAAAVLYIDNTMTATITRPGADLRKAVQHMLQGAAQLAAHCGVQDPADMADWVRNQFYCQLVQAQETEHEKRAADDTV